MNKTQYGEIFFNTDIPLANCEKLKSFIAEQFGFNKEHIKVLRSHGGHCCYPLFKDKKCNYILFEVKGITYSCINGKLQLLEESR